MTTIVNGKMVRNRFGIRFWETVSSGSGGIGVELEGH